ncbi:hypothetical protein FI667_g5140, partial [Globisporangium splendens]
MLARTTAVAASKQGAVVARTCCGYVTCHTFLLAQIATQASVPNADGSYSFVKSRTAYRAEVAALRKEFVAEVARRKEKLARDAEYAAAFSLPPYDAAQRLKIMKEKAARLEIKRQQQAIRAEEVAREKALHEEKVRQYFEEKVLVREARNAEVERRREALLATLRQQSSAWITAENLQEKLKEDVFIYSPHQISARSAFDPSSTTGSAMSWLEKLQRMKPAGVKTDDDVADEDETKKE